MLWNHKKYNKDVSNSNYDCTNYYFEISYNKGYRKDLIIQMEYRELPLSYNLFSGNDNENKNHNNQKMSKPR